MKTVSKIIIAGSAVTLLAGCASFGGSSAPDEFRVVTKAPLVIPPDYSLRPPQAGQAQPAEVDETRASTASAFGTSIGINASASERALVAAAGANAVSPIIREQVDYEQARVIRKSNSITDRIMFWERGEEETADSATGGEPVTIERGSGDRLKLPGT